MSTSEYYSEYYDDGFEGYIETTNDPGWTLLVLTTVFCFLSVAILPCLVRWGKQYDLYRTRRKAETPAHQQQPIEQSGKQEARQSIGNLLNALCARSADNGNSEIQNANQQRTIERGQTWEISSDVVDNGNSQNFTEDGETFHTSSEIPSHYRRTSTRSDKTSGTPQIPCESNASEIKATSEKASGCTRSSRVAFSEAVEELVLPSSGHSTYTQSCHRSYASHESDFKVSADNVSAQTPSEPSNTIVSFFETVVSSHPRSRWRMVAGWSNAQTPAVRTQTLQKDLEKEYECEVDDESSERGNQVAVDAERMGWADFGNVATLSQQSLKHFSATHLSQVNCFSTYPLDVLLGTDTPVSSEDVSTIRDPSEKAFAFGTGVEDISPKDAPDYESTLVAEKYKTDGISNENVDLGICCGRNALWKPWTIRSGFDGLVELSEFDKESKRIFKLTMPFTLSSVSYSVFANIYVVLIARFLGTNAVAAVTVTELFLGMTGGFLGGLVNAQISITSHALGAGNTYLAGQYVQQTMILFTICYIPTFAIWWFYIGPAASWLGMSEKVADSAQSYARVVLVNNWMHYILSSLNGMYQVTDHENFPTIVHLTHGILNLAACAPTLMYYDGVTLTTLAFLDMAAIVVTFLIALLYPLHKGWLKIFIPGWLCKFSLSDTKALWNLTRTAAPLAFGQLLAYGEWEVLTLFCGHLGPAEVAAWGILGYIWEAFEACTQGIGDAAEIRVAFHLGRGAPKSAKISGYKSTIFGTVIACVITAVFWIIGDDLPRLYTSDLTLQHLMLEAIPLVGIGNIAMTFGMISWSVVGAQGRYHLATAVATVSSWVVTTPLAAFFVYALRYDIQGLVAAVAIGYSFCGMLMAYIMLRSDWAGLSKLVQERNATTGEEVGSGSHSGSLPVPPNSSSHSISGYRSSSSNGSSDSGSVPKSSPSSCSASRPGEVFSSDSGSTGEELGESSSNARK